jgi:hypothetical protein
MEIILGKDSKELKGTVHIINTLKIGAKILEKPSNKKRDYGWKTVESKSKHQT